MKNPFRRKDPYRSMPITRAKLSTQRAPIGFVETIPGDIDKVAKDVLSLEQRLGYRPDQGDPAAYVGEFLFEPQSDVHQLDVFQDGSPTVPVNVVVPSGQELQVPVILQGPGAFLARTLTVKLYQRFFDPTNGVTWVPLPYGRTFFDVDSTSALGSEVQTLKWSLMHDFAWLGEAAFSSNTDRIFGTNFFWNFVDEDSQRRLADDLLPSQCLKPQGWQRQADGNIYNFESPWLFERANTVTFRMQMINEVLQLDPTAAVFPVNGVDDRENNGTVRNQTVKVRVELHGTKFYNSRDQLLREAT